MTDDARIAHLEDLLAQALAYVQGHTGEPELPGTSSWNSECLTRHLGQCFEDDQVWPAVGAWDWSEDGPDYSDLYDGFRMGALCGPGDDPGNPTGENPPALVLWREIRAALRLPTKHVLPSEALCLAPLLLPDLED
jgi:hypothetical protein